MVNIRSKTCWNLHFRSTRGNVAGISLALKPLFNSSTLAAYNKSLLYNSCTDYHELCLSICYFTCKSSMDNLNKLHRKYIGIFRNALRYLRNTSILNGPTFRKRIVVLSSKFYKDFTTFLRKSCWSAWLRRLRPRPSKKFKIFYDWGRRLLHTYRFIFFSLLKILINILK